MADGYYDVAQDDELTEAWDRFDRLPEPGANPALDAFCERKHLSINALVKLGARLADYSVLAFAYPGGLKFRDVVTDKRWNYPGSEFSTLKLVFAGASRAPVVIVAEGETDAACLTMLYPAADVAILPAGANPGRHVTNYAEQLNVYELVLLGHDYGVKGDEGAALLADHLTVPWLRWLAPLGDDPADNTGWGDVPADAEVPPLPSADDVPSPPSLRIEYGFNPGLVRAKQWLWDRWIPVGAITLLIGEGDVGKGTFGCAFLIPAITRGAEWQREHGLEPLDGTYAEPQRVLVVADEDDWHEDWVPRLVAGGADLRMVAHLAQDEYLDNLSKDAGRLRDQCSRDGIKLVWFDQLLDHIDGGRDGAGVYNPKVVRDALRPLRRAAHEGGFAPVCTLHPSKGRKGTFTDLAPMSAQFGAVARAGLILAMDPTDDTGTKRILVRGKGKAEAVPARTFAIVPQSVSVADHDFRVPVIRDWAEDLRTLDDLADAAKRPVGSARDDDAAALAAAYAACALDEWQWLKEQPDWPPERADGDATRAALKKLDGIEVDYAAGKGYRFRKTTRDEPTI